MDFLQNGKFTQGSPDTTFVANDKPKSFKDKIKSHSLRASGLIYSVGNAFYIASGIARKKQAAQIGTGVAFSAGDVMVAIFGGKDDERQFKSLLTKLTKHLEKNGVPIPKDSAIFTEISTKGESVSEKSYDFVHEHINKIKALAEVIGGLFYFKAGKDQGNRWKQATSVIFTLGFGSSIFIKEKKPDPDKLKNAGPLEKAWAFVEEKPLRVAGWSGLSNTLFTTIGALQERKAELLKPGGGTNYYKYDLGASGSMLIANNLYALSNKSTGGTITSGSLIDDLYGLTAQVINREPEEKREKALKTAVEFLGDRIEIRDTRKQVEAKLRQHMAHAVNENPWFKAKGEEAHKSIATPESPGQTLTPAQDKNWTEFVTQPQPLQNTGSEVSPGR